MAPPGNIAGSTQAVTVYDVAHPKPWGWKVATYLWTKSVGGGALAVAGPLLAAGFLSPALTAGAGLIAALFTVLTAVLLVWDLKRPERFWRVLLTPNPRSWLVWGAYILTLYGLVAGLWLLSGLLGAGSALRLLLAPGILLGLAAAAYSAFLFGQAEGRDFWQSPLLLWQLLAAALLGGAASTVLVAAVVDTGNTRLLEILTILLLAGVLGTFGIVLAELYTLHANKDVAAAAAYAKRGPAATRLWLGYALLGVALPTLLLLGVLTAGLPLGASMLAALAALVGLWCYEDVWVRAGQSVAMS
jgi:formate-dependent nitrite reductase membrane component NrfD